MQYAQLIYFLLIGIVAGICSGLFGIGGGVVLVPMLVILLKFPQQTASGTSLVALLLPVGALGALQYYRAGKIGAEHAKWGLWIALGIFIGTYFGSKLAVTIPESVMKRIFTGFMVAMTIRLWI